MKSTSMNLVRLRNGLKQPILKNLISITEISISIAKMEYFILLMNGSTTLLMKVLLKILMKVLLKFLMKLVLVNGSSVLLSDIKINYLYSSSLIALYSSVVYIISRKSEFLNIFNIMFSFIMSIK